MKKIILNIVFLIPLFVGAQTRVLNTEYSDGTFGKPVPDTIRTLIAGANITIKSGGTSLVDTISATGGGGSAAGATGNIQFKGSTGLFSASSLLTYDSTNNYLGIGGTPSYNLDVETNSNAANRINIKNASSGTAAQALYQAQNNASVSFQEGTTSSGFTTAGLITPNTVFFQGNNNSRLVFRSISLTAPIIFGNGFQGNTEAMRIFANGSVSINGNGTDSSAYLVLPSGTTALSSLKINSGVAPTSPISGQMWYETTNTRLMFRQNATSVELLGASSVNTVSPTSPNRTITVVVGGVTYYIAAKTTND